MRRRALLRGAVRGLTALAAGAPAHLRAEASRPRVDWGAQVGDAVGDAAILWSRTDRPARLHLEWSTTESFEDRHLLVGPAALEDSDFTARVDLRGLPPGQTIVYRATFQDLHDLRAFSLPVSG
ncbi:MAG TPA: PhoD-like phosphatase N-terminal domain-containing protein, partial [Vicinamibacteria bacterium]|nr:PhoD-like phosphatase N-terminal domain-containing protein [Vicinamibacteria bacterium]